MEKKKKEVGSPPSTPIPDEKDDPGKEREKEK